MEIAWIIKNRLWLLSVTVFVLWSIGCYLQGARHEQAKQLAKDLEVKKIELANEQFNIKTGFEIGSKYEKTKDSIEFNFNKYTNSLQSRSEDSENVTSSKSNEKAYCDKLSRESKRRLLMLMKEAELNTMQLIALQDYIEKSL